MKNWAEKRNKFSFIVLVVCALIIIFFQLFFSQMISSDFSVHMRDQRKESISRMVQLAYNSVKPIVGRIHSGEIDNKEARILISNLVRKMTYKDEYGFNYIFMSSYDGTMLVQPFDPQKEGSNQWELKDAEGTYIIQKLIKAAKEKPEGSFVAYQYFVPNKDKVEEKLSYVMGIPEIEAYIGTGMYVESSYLELEKILKRQRYSFLLLTIAILAVLMNYVRILIKGNNRLIKEIRERKTAEANLMDSKKELQNQYLNLQKTQEELQLKHDELSAIHEELSATEEELRKQYEELGKSQSEVRKLAYFDYLTGLPNRVFIVNDLKDKLGKCSLKGCNGSVFFIDVDNFKIINDTFGHFYGDKVLIALAEKMNTLQKDNIIIGRIGGDEFIVVQDVYKDELQIKDLAEQILTIFSTPVFIEGNNFNVTCSIGIALYPKDGYTVEEILKNADLAMYLAKSEGKNKFVCFENKMSADLAERIELERHLRDAFKNNEFELYYQPKVDTAKGDIVGYEALLRWISPVHGIVSPAKFIPIVEEMGLINELGKWVIDESFAFAKTFSDRNIRISCNISSIQLMQSSFVQDVIEAFEKHGLERESVALEITESCLIESFGETTEKLAKLRENGILIYLDDFGTGYSSLTYLKDLPIDIVKIDKSFLDNITNDGVESRIVKTIISLAHEIGLEVVAEGVETKEQREYLNSFSCNYIQGYLISKPIPKHEIIRLFT